MFGKKPKFKTKDIQQVYDHIASKADELEEIIMFGSLGTKGDELQATSAGVMSPETFGRIVVNLMNSKPEYKHGLMNAMLESVLVKQGQTGAVDLASMLDDMIQESEMDDKIKDSDNVVRIKPDKTIH